MDDYAEALQALLSSAQARALSFALSHYELPASLPSDVALDTNALLLCLFADTALLPIIALSLVVAIIALRPREPVLVFPPPSPAKPVSVGSAAASPASVPAQQAPLPARRTLADEKSFTDLAHRLTVAATSSTAKATKTPSPSASLTARRSMFVPPTALIQRVDIFDATSPPYDSPRILPVRLGQLSDKATKPIPFPPITPPKEDIDGGISSLVEDLVEDAVWASEFSRELDRIVSPASKAVLELRREVEEIERKHPLPKLAYESLGMKVQREMEKVPLVEKWSEADINPFGTQPAKVEGLGIGFGAETSAAQRDASLSPNKHRQPSGSATSSPSKYLEARAPSPQKLSPKKQQSASEELKPKFEEMLTEIDQLTFGNSNAREREPSQRLEIEVAIERYVRSDKQNSLRTDFRILFSTYDSPEDAIMHEALPSPPRGRAPVRPEPPKSMLPRPIPKPGAVTPTLPTATSIASDKGGFAGLWSAMPRQPAKSPARDYTPRSLRPAVRVFVKPSNTDKEDKKDAKEEGTPVSAGETLVSSGSGHAR